MFDDIERLNDEDLKELKKKLNFKKEKKEITINQVLSKANQKQIAKNKKNQNK